VQRPVTEARGYRIIQPHHKTWVRTSEIPNSTPQRPSGGSVSWLHSASDTAERPLEEELAAERQTAHARKQPDAPSSGTPRHHDAHDQRCYKRAASCGTHRLQPCR
jgi:hypothetical protein